MASASCVVVPALGPALLDGEHDPERPGRAERGRPRTARRRMASTSSSTSAMRQVADLVGQGRLVDDDHGPAVGARHPVDRLHGATLGAYGADPDRPGPGRPPATGVRPSAGRPPPAAGRAGASTAASASHRAAWSAARTSQRPSDGPDDLDAERRAEGVDEGRRRRARHLGQRGRRREPQQLPPLALGARPPAPGRACSAACTTSWRGTKVWSTSRPPPSLPPTSRAARATSPSACSAAR